MTYTSKQGLKVVRLYTSCVPCRGTTTASNKDKMDSDELYKILGRITYSYSRIDFLISHIATDLGIATNPYQFYSGTRFDKKIESLKTGAKKITSDEARVEFFDWLDKLDGLRQERNTVIHSIILKNSEDDNEYRLFNYRKSGDQVVSEIYDYSTDDLKRVDKELIDAHNKGHEFWKMIKV